MLTKKVVCAFLGLAASLTTGVALDRLSVHAQGTEWADGGAPTPPPIPWLLSAGDDPSYIVADGGAPTPPPIPWLYSSASDSIERLSS